MRVKRQRRKLRGKYSGNCLSCDAKWSKCWYIASIDNQREWETRLNKVVTPGDDEVCFQCWDAKIRTSPKRKIHFKASNLKDQSVAPSLVKRDTNTNRHKRRALSGDFECTIHAASGLSVAHSRDYEAGSYANFIANEIEPASIYEESVIFDEENAVVLLSTAFRTIPLQINDVNINIEISSYEVCDNRGFSDDKAQRRGAYYCGKCGKLKKGHLCDVPSPDPECPSPSIQSISIQLSPVLPQLSSLSPAQLSSVDVTVAAFAQPVVS